MAIVINYEPNNKQSQFHSCNATEALYGGAKGGGKSCALVMETLAYALENAGCECYLFRETFDDLEANLIREWKEKVPSQLYTYHATKYTATLINGSVVKFRYVRNYQDAEKYQGRSIDFIGVDELTKHEERSIQELLSCSRSPKGFKPTFRATANPGGIGHAWVKKRYISPTEYGGKRYKDPLTGNTIAFIPATVYDNDILMQNDPAYVKRLENLPEKKKKAFLYGDWDSFEGMALEKWNEAIHVVEPFQIPNHWRRWIAVDNGYTDPFAWYWFAVDELGTVYIYREFTRDYDHPKLTYSQQAEKVLEMSKTSRLENGEVVEDYEKIDFIVVGHDAWAVHPSTKTPDRPQGKSILDYYTEAGLTKLAGFIKPITDRKLRLSTWIEYIEPIEDQDGNLTSKVKVFSNCKYLREYLPMQVTDENDVEKVAETTIDHWYDAAGYGLIAHHANKSKAPKEDLSEIQQHKQRLIERNKRSARKQRLS